MFQTQFLLFCLIFSCTRIRCEDDFAAPTLLLNENVESPMMRLTKDSEIVNRNRTKKTLIGLQTKLVKSADLVLNRTRVDSSKDIDHPTAQIGFNPLEETINKRTSASEEYFIQNGDQKNYEELNPNEINEQRTVTTDFESMTNMETPSEGEVHNITRFENEKTASEPNKKNKPGAERGAEETLGRKVSEEELPEPEGELELTPETREAIEMTAREGKGVNLTNLGRYQKTDADRQSVDCDAVAQLLSCTTNYTLDLNHHRIATWQLKCGVNLSCGGEISVALEGVKGKNYFLHFISDISSYKSKRRENNLSPVCIPNNDHDYVCLRFHPTTHIEQPEYVTLHPFFILGDDPDNRIDLGSLELVITNGKHKRDNHHPTKQDITGPIFKKQIDRPIFQYRDPTFESNSESDKAYRYHDDGVHDHVGYQGDNTFSSGYHGNAAKVLYDKSHVKKFPDYHGNRLDASTSGSYLHGYGVNKNHFHGSSFDVPRVESQNEGWVPSQSFITGA